MPSYSNVFSQPFIEYTHATPESEFLVPEGFTAVIREIDLYEQFGLAHIQVGITGPGAAATIYFAALNVTSVDNSSVQWRGRVVALEGYTISLYEIEFGDNDCAYVGGYLLRNTLS